MKTDAWIADVSWDYPGLCGSDDTKIPLANVWFRVAYGTSYKGNAEVKRLRDIYESQGINFYGVIVPASTSNWLTQQNQALAALSVCRGVEFDVEPYGGYLGSEVGLQAWVDNVLAPLRHDYPNELRGKDISLCYDPREQWLDGWDFGRAVSLSDSLAPMVYTGMYSGQGHWGEPIGAIRAARAQCPLDKVFRPILQVYSIDPLETIVAFKETLRVSGHPILFRRGVTPVETWRAIEAIGEAVPAESYPVPPKEGLTMGQYEELKAEIARLDGRISSIPAGPPGPPGPPGRTAPSAPVGANYTTVVSGDTASGIAAANGISLGQLKALNPGEPRSGDWNLIHPGEQFRVR